MGDIGLSRKVVLHLYNSAVVHTVASIAQVVQWNETAGVKNPRHKDLRALYESIHADKRQLFFEAVAAIVEYAVFRTLSFIESYNRFDSEGEDNPDEFPRLSLVYEDRKGEEIERVVISKFNSGFTVSAFDSDRLHMLFKEVARSSEMRALVDSLIEKLTAENPGQSLSGE